jgi:hypothetical protein
MRLHTRHELLTLDCFFLPSRPQLHASMEREGELDASFAMSSMERMRARCTVPRDVVMVYEALNKVGLQYGPAFRLLTDVYVPEATATTQAAAHAAGHA